MPKKKNGNLTPGEKLLMLYLRLILDGRKHSQNDLADFLGCSPQSVKRMVGVIERVLGKDSFIESGRLEDRRCYYRFRSKTEEKTLGFSTFEELHYIATCRDLAAPFLPEGQGCSVLSMTPGIR